MDPTAGPVHLSDMRRIVTVSAAALVVLAAVLVVVLTQRPPVSQVAPVHAKLLPVHPSVVQRPVIVPGGPARNLEPAQPMPSSSSWVHR